MKGPAARTLEWCRRQGWPADVAGRWIAPAKRRIDLFGFIDIVALDGNPGLLAIQATTAANAASRIAKIMTAELARTWLLARNRIEVHGWRKAANTGRWQVNRWVILWVFVDEIMASKRIE